MGLLSILLSGLAVVCAGVGVLTTPIPQIGLIFAFGAPVLALGGIMLGGSAMSKAKRAGQTSETGRIGAILNALAFVPSVLVALTCGVCNAFFSSGDLHVQKNFQLGVSPFRPDAGALVLPAPQRPPAGEPSGSDARPGHPADQRPQHEPAAPAAPAPLPPPPLPPGPGK